MPSRREFLSASAAAVAATRWPTPRLESSAKVKTILFQGDSITDAGRDRSHTGPNDIAGLGEGYPLLLAAELRGEHPDADLQIFNRGISGHRVPDLATRWQSDTIALAPDLLSILIGVNDVWHTRNKNYDGTPAKYEAGYAALLASTRAALPSVRLVVMEPFVLRVGAVDDSWFPEFDHYRAAAKRVAKGAGATFVPLHDYLQDLAKESGPAYWAADGVHPTLAGHQAIAERWSHVVKVG